MKKVCAWCGRPLGDEHDPDGAGRWITHGICSDCRDKMLNTLAISLSEFLDMLPEPVLLVDERARVLGANEAARRTVPDSTAVGPDQLLGEVFECVHAQSPGGCGRTIHCSGCAIRRAVTDTYRTGESSLRVPATLTLGPEGEPSPVRLLVTTEKVGDRVLLRVDEALDAD
jgi:hypothetical protein